MSPKGLRSTSRAVLPVLLVWALNTALVHASAPAPTSTLINAVDQGSGLQYTAPAGLGISSPDSFVVQGTSYDSGCQPAGVPTSVLVRVQDIDAVTYLQPDGTWSPTRYTFRILVPSQNVSCQMVMGSQTWVGTWSFLPPGQNGTGWSGAKVIFAQTVTQDGTTERPPQELQMHIGQPNGTSPFITISFGRSTYAQYDGSGCQGSPFSKTLVEAANQMQSMGLFGVANVVYQRTLTAPARECIGRTSYANWDDLAYLHAAPFNWKVISAGKVYHPLGAIAPSQWNLPISDVGDPSLSPASNMQDEICGSEQALTAIGYPEAIGEFAYPNNSYTDLLQASTPGTSITSNCYDWGRTYLTRQFGTPVPPILPDPVQTQGTQVVDQYYQPPPAPYWYMRSESVSGGLCRYQQPDLPGQPYGSGVPCTGSLAKVSYTNVDYLVTMATSLAPGHWLDLQFYRFVDGTRLAAPGVANPALWDCSSNDWKMHWTNQGELFCWSDFLTVLGAIQTAVAAGAALTDPATVGTAWGHPAPSP